MDLTVGSPIQKISCDYLKDSNTCINNKCHWDIKSNNCMNIVDGTIIQDEKTYCKSFKDSNTCINNKCHWDKKDNNCNISFNESS